MSPKDKRDLKLVAKRALTYSGIVVMILAILMGVYYMGIRYQRARCINKTGVNVSHNTPACIWRNSPPESMYNAIRPQ